MKFSLAAASLFLTLAVAAPTGPLGTPSTSSTPLLNTPLIYLFRRHLPARRQVADDSVPAMTVGAGNVVEFDAANVDTSTKKSRDISTDTEPSMSMTPGQVTPFDSAAIPAGPTAKKTRDISTDTEPSMSVVAGQVSPFSNADLQ